MKSAACNRDPNEVEALLRKRGLGESVCPNDGLRPGQHGWSAAKPLRVGSRVWARKGHARHGVVTFVKRTHTRFVYMVRWDGNAHESGEYGLRDLGHRGR